MFPTLLGLRFRGDTLESCSVSTGGGMRGGSRELSLKRGDDGGVLRVSYKESHDERLQITEYRVDAEAFDRICKIVDSCRLYAASKLPYSKVRVLDGDTTSISFTYHKDFFRVSEEQIMSVRMRKGFREFVQLLESLAVGEGTKSQETQRAVLYLKNGYTLTFTVEDAFDGKLDSIFEEEHEVSVFEENGIVLASGVQPDISGAQPAEQVTPSDLIYDPQSKQIILLYAEYTFTEPVYLLARINGYAPSACPLIAEMEGTYRLRLN